MAATSTTALDLITGAMRNIGALEAGETPNAQDAADAQQVLNDLVEAWSLERLFIYASNENTFAFTAGKYQYTIGNYVAGTFNGTLVSGSPTISGVTVPSNLIVGGTLTDVQAAIPSGTTILAIGASTITMSANALATVSSAESITYTIPGDIPIPRPLRITNAFTRITTSASSLDYPLEIVNQDRYSNIGLKGLPGPWPLQLYYNAGFPLGTIYFYPNPSSAGVLHLWTDLILSDFAQLTQAINLPQGYSRALKKNLALELAPEYGRPASPLLVKQAKESKEAIKDLNSDPVVHAFFDSDLVRSNRTDAGWILSGGF